MKTINAVTKYGGSAKESRDGFKLTAAADLTDEQILVAAGYGLASMLYRGGASVLNKALDVKNNAATEYSEDDAKTIAEALVKWAKGSDSPIDGGFDLVVDVSKHVHGEGAEPKFAQAKKIFARHAEKKDLPEFAVNVIGYDGEVGDATNPNQEFIVAINEYIKTI